MWLRGLALSLALVLTGPQVFAQEADKTADVVQVPDPANLVNGWWAYLGEAPKKELAGRIATFGQRIDALLATLGSSEEDEKARALAIEINGLLKAFTLAHAAKQGAKAGEALAGATPASSVEGLLELSSKRLEVTLELERSSREAEEQDVAVDAAKQHAGDALAAYIAMDPKAPGHLVSGLEIVRLRLFWALGVIELENLQAAKARLEQEHKAILTEIERGSTSLSATESEQKRWLARLQAANEARARLGVSAAESRLRTTAFANDALGQAQRRQLQQQLLDLQVRRALENLRHGESVVALDLVTAALGKSVELGLQRTHRKDLDDIASSVGKQLGGWRRASEQERTSANEQLSQDADLKPLQSVNRARVQQADTTAQSLLLIGRQLARADLLLELAGKRIVEQGGQVGQLTAKAGEGLRDLWEQIKDFSTRSLFTVNDTPVTALGFLRFTIIVLLAWLVSRLVRKGFEKLIARRENMNRASIFTLSRLFHYLILTIGFFVAFSSIGIDFTKFALIASAFGVGLGFGLQAIFSNFVAGLIILFERSLKVGDFVELESGVAGEVQSVNIRSTLVTTNDNIDILVPNSEFVNGRVTNWTLREAYRRVRIPFGVAYGTDKELVKRAALEASDAVSHTLMAPGREPQVWMVKFGDSSLDFELVVWLKPDSVKRPGAVNAAYTWALETALVRHGIEIPFPQRDLHVRSAFGHKDEAGPKMLASISEIRKGPRDGPVGERIDE